MARRWDGTAQVAGSGKICKDAKIEVIIYQELRRRLATIIARSAGVDVAAQALNHSPHTGDRVIRLFYYNPDLEAVDKATCEAWQSLKGDYSKQSRNSCSSSGLSCKACSKSLFSIPLFSK